MKNFQWCASRSPWRCRKTKKNAGNWKHVYFFCTHRIHVLCHIYLHEWLILMVNLGSHADTIHGWYGICTLEKWMAGTPIKMEVCFRWFLFFNWVICRFRWFIFRGVMGPIFEWIKQSLHDSITISGKGYNNPCKFPCGNVPLVGEREISSTRVLIWPGWDTEVWTPRNNVCAFCKDFFSEVTYYFLPW